MFQWLKNFMAKAVKKPALIRKVDTQDGPRYQVWLPTGNKHVSGVPASPKKHLTPGGASLQAADMGYKVIKKE